MFNHSLPFNIYNKSCCDAKVHPPPPTPVLFSPTPPPPPLLHLQACHALEVPLIFHATGPLSFDPSSERMRCPCCACVVGS